MDRTQYWELIEQARAAVPGGDADAVSDAFVVALSEHDPECISDAWLRHHELVHEAATLEMRGAAHLLFDGCSDESFRLFRSWLITRGRDIYDEVLDDPDALADILSDGPIVDSDLECEELEDAPSIAYLAVVGEAMPEHRDLPDDPDLGDLSVFDDPAEAARCYPRLAARLGLPVTV